MNPENEQAADAPVKKQKTELTTLPQSAMALDTVPTPQTGKTDNLSIIYRTNGQEENDKTQWTDKEHERFQEGYDGQHWSQGCPSESTFVEE